MSRKGELAAALLLTVLAPLGFGGDMSAAKADLRQAIQAFETGDYERARNEWTGPAQRGDPEAEFGLGEVYEQADGDYRNAELWYSKAAEHGNVKAMYRLALISMAGNKEQPPDLVKAYKWATLAAERDGVWAELGKDLRGELQTHSSAGDQLEGARQADLWKARHDPKLSPPAPAAPALTAPIVPPAQPAGGSLSARNQAGCTPPGWPGPPLPCSNSLPTIPGQSPPAAPFAIPPRVQPDSIVPATPPDPGFSPLEQLTAALKRVQCASLRGTISAQGMATVTGTVPDQEERNKVIQAAARLSANSRPDVNVEIVPAPLCRALIEFDGMRVLGLASEGIALRLINADGRLREGEPIKVEVRGPAHPVRLRIDYFSLDGQVLHMWPNAAEPAIELHAREVRVFGDPRKPNGKVWNAGGAPFGIEFIAVTATPQELGLGFRDEVERAEDYLSALEQELRKLKTATAPAAVVATLLVHTSQ